MGGWGSGRPENLSRRKTTKDAYAVDVLTWYRHGKLTAGSAFEWGHMWGYLDTGYLAMGKALLTEPPLRIEVVQEFDTGNPDFLNVSFPRYGSHQPREEIALEWTACTYGGYRPWLRCRGCKERVRKLYLDLAELRPKLRCRQCLGLAYESQRQDVPRRTAEAAKRGRKKVGGWLASGLLTPFPDRPKGMHHATYERLRAVSQEAEVNWISMETMDTLKKSEDLHKRFPTLRQYQVQEHQEHK